MLILPSRRLILPGSPEWDEPRRRTCKCKSRRGGEPLRNRLVPPGEPGWDEPPRRTRKSGWWEETLRGRRAGLTRLQPGSCCSPCSTPPSCMWMCSGTPPSSLTMSVTGLGTFTLPITTSPLNWNMGTDTACCTWELNTQIASVSGTGPCSSASNVGLTLIVAAITGCVFYFWISVSYVAAGTPCGTASFFDQCPSTGTKGVSTTGFAQQIGSTNCTGNNYSWSSTFGMNSTTLIAGDESAVYAVFGGDCTGKTVLFTVSVSG